MTQLQTTPEMFEFMMKKLGGANMVRVEFFKDKISALANSNTTIDEVLKEARSEGWDTWFTGLRFSDLSRMLGASTVSSRTGTGTRSGKRLTNNERDGLLNNILDFLKDNPWSSVKVISKHVGMPSRNVGLQLKAMREKNQIKTQGEKASMRYSLA